MRLKKREKSLGIELETSYANNVTYYYNGAGNIVFNPTPFKIGGYSHSFNNQLKRMWTSVGKGPKRNQRVKRKLPNIQEKKILILLDGSIINESVLRNCFVYKYYRLQINNVTKQHNQLKQILKQANDFY